MTLTDAQALAIKFGAMQFAGPQESPAFGCWEDRIAWLPNAAERGAAALQAAAAEANRYSGHRHPAPAPLYSAGMSAKRRSAEPLQSLAMSAKRKSFDIAGRGL